MTVIKRKPVHYVHDVIYYVPVYQIDYDDNGDLNSSPTFEYSMSEAATDPHTAWSFKPDYVLELHGRFDAVTKPLIVKDEDN